MQRKGQITIFIIIGIILLATASILIYMNQSKKTIEQEAVLPKLSIIEAGLQPVRDYVTKCISIIGEEGLRIIGVHGGYIDTDSFDVNLMEPTDGEAVKLPGETSPVVPYWYYLKTENGKIGKMDFARGYPLLKKSGGSISIEGQLEEYIDEKLPGCASSYSEGGVSLSIIEAPETLASITKQGVILKVDMPIDAIKDGVSKRIPDYAATLNIDLVSLYELAIAITEQEAEYSLFEATLYEIISIFSGLDKSLPPPSASSMDQGPGKIWIKSKVLGELKNVIAMYTQMIRVWGTRTFEIITPTGGVANSEIFDTVFNRGMIFVTDEEASYPELNIKFLYLPFLKPYFNMNCRGEVCQGETVSSFFPIPFALQRYHFVYDLSYPVLVSLENPFAFDGRGYNFQYFLEANMRANGPVPTEYEPATVIETAGPSLLCDLNQRTSPNITITVTDGRTGMPVNNSIITYAVGSESCNLGATNSSGKIFEQFPEALGGIVGANKQGYHSSFSPMDTAGNPAQLRNIVLEPYRNVGIGIELYQVEKGSGEHSSWSADVSASTVQSPKHQTTITLKRESSKEAPEFSAVASICGTGTGIPGSVDPELSRICKDTSKKVKLLPGKYKITIIATLHDNMVIPEEERKKCWYEVGIKHCKRFTMPEVKFDFKNPFRSGTTEYDVEITKEELDSSSRVVFKGFNIAMENVDRQKRVIEDMNVLGKIDNYVRENRDSLVPEYK